MEEQIKVVTLNLNETNPRVEIINNTIEALQQAVDGQIEYVPLSNRIVLYVNEEGKMRGYGHNFQLVNHFGQKLDDIVGNVIFTRVDSHGEGVSLTEEDVLWIKQHFIDRKHFLFREG